MKKSSSFWALLSLSFIASAQVQLTESRDLAICQRTPIDENDQLPALKSVSIHQGPENIVWSQDFANGIPSNWQNINNLSSGFALWEYRGPSGAQPATVGSRGAYANQATVINSPTASNGFVIFDSDYLDNNGVAGNFGGGIAPSPHQTSLITESINLSAHSNIDLKFNQYYRRFSGPGGSQAVVATYVDISTNGGVTWSNTLTYNTNVSVNGSTPLNDVQNRDISSIVAGQANVKIRFRFDGDYYFWMIDDIELSSVPKFRIEFSAQTSQPLFDIIYGPIPNTSARFGQMPSIQRERNITFNCNAMSSGTHALYNAQLQMVISRNGTPLTTINGPIYTSAWGGPGTANDFLSSNDLNTNSSPFQTNAPGIYEYFYRVVADTNAAGNGTPISISSDTLQFIETDSVLALDANLPLNAIGTTEWGNGGAFGVLFDFVDTAISNISAYGYSIPLANTPSRPTVPGGILYLSIYPESGLVSLISGFNPNTQLFGAQITITQAHVDSGFVRFDLRTNGTPLLLPNTAANNSYYFVVALNSNSGLNPIHINNDQSFGQTSSSKLMYITNQGRWFTGYTGSRSFNSPLARLHLSATAPSPNVFTDSVTNVTQFTATAFGRTLVSGPAPILARGFCYSTTGNPTLANSLSPAGSGQGSFNSNLSGLSSNTTYFIKAYATNSTGTSYGNELSFTTTQSPSVFTDSITNITLNSANIYGRAIATGPAPIVARGFCYDTIGNPTISNNINPVGAGPGSFNSSLSALMPNTLYFVKAYAINSLGTSYGNELSFNTTISPNAFTDSVTNVTQNSATIYGRAVDAAGSAPIVARGFCYNTAGNPNILDSNSTAGSGAGSFNINLSALTPNTTYFVKAYATTSLGTIYGNELSFTTAQILSVFTDSVANVTQNTAIPYGRALAAGPAAITSRGFCYNTTGNPTISSSTSPAGSGPGSFNNNLSGLTPNTTYFVKAYATTSLGTTYGNELSFTTSMPGMPTLSTDSVANIANNSATAFGTVVSNGGSNLTARGFCYNTSGNPSLADNITTAGIAVGSYSSILSGLSQNTTYFIKSYATNSAGTAYGNELSFTTTNIGLEILNAAKIKVYPNPGQHKVYVDAPIGSNIQLIDLQGRVWRSTTSQNPQTELLLSDLASGTYIIEVESDQRITQVKWIKP